MFALIQLLILPAALAAIDTRFIAVSGHCMKRVSPDRGTLQLTAEARESDPGKASSKATGLYEKLRADIKKLSLKDGQLQTTTYNVSPEFDYKNGKQTLRHYRAAMGIEIETSELQRMGELIQVAGRLGIQNAGGFNVFLSAEKRKEVYEGCLEEAIQNARSKAERMAKAGGSKLADVLTIEEHKSDRRPPEPPMMMKAAAMDSEMGGAPAIESKNLGIEVQVAVSFGLK